MIFTVAIDGPAAAGKGTIAREVARRFGMAHLDTGILYRATARRVLDGADAVAAARALSPEDIGRSDLRTAEVGRVASQVAVLPEVRAALVAFQRDFARREGGAVLDGRDIGTVICPGAETKLFVMASDACRAARRFAELAASGGRQTEAEVLADLRERDLRDSEREIAPLRPAPDAIVIDTTDLTIAEAVEVAAEAVGRAIAAHRSE